MRKKKVRRLAYCKEVNHPPLPSKPRQKRKHDIERPLDLKRPKNSGANPKCINELVYWKKSKWKPTCNPRPHLRHKHRGRLLQRQLEVKSYEGKHKEQRTIVAGEEAPGPVAHERDKRQTFLRFDKFRPKQKPRDEKEHGHRESPDLSVKIGTRWAPIPGAEVEICNHAVTNEHVCCKHPAKAVESGVLLMRCLPRCFQSCPSRHVVYKEREETKQRQQDEISSWTLYLHRAHTLL